MTAQPEQDIGEKYSFNGRRHDSDEAPTDQEAPNVYFRFKSGGSFILDTDPNPKPIWGEDEDCLQSDGEALVFAGPQGVGKTTLAQQYGLARCGFSEYSTLLGFPIVSGRRHVLYLAMDRPKQVARSFRRMVGEAWRAELDERLSVWEGPPPYDMARYPNLLLKLCEDADAGTVIVDSLKDAAIGLSDDDVGAAYNRGRQKALAAGVQVAELHHLRKALSGAKAEHPTIDDVYGSTWLTSGAGSVILLNGRPGDPIVSFHHLKQPATEVGPYRIIHDRETGRSEIYHAADLLQIARAQGSITAIDAAKALFETDDPDRNEKEKARYRLQQLEKAGLVVLLDKGDKHAKKPAIWGLP
jgi:replicative DNA helicase